MIAPQRITPRQPHFGMHTGQGRGVDRDAADILPSDPVSHCHRGIAAQFLEFATGLFQLSGVQLDQPCQSSDHLVHVAGLFADHGDPVAWHILGDDPTLAVENTAACWRNELNVDAVLIGQEAELVGLFKLHVAHAQRERAHHTQL